ncbi:MAG: alpha/beta fold hydrolase [Candidatus Hodarchaeales archaeon]
MIKPFHDDFEHYLRIQTIGGATWHPLEDKIAFIYDQPGHFQIFTVPIEQNKTLWPTRLTYDLDRTTNPNYLSDGSLIFMKDNGGDENFQFNVFNPIDGLNSITSDLFAKHVINLITTEFVYFAANIQDKTAFGIYRLKIPISKNEPELLYYPDSGYFAAQALSPTEEKLVVRKYFGNNHQELYVLEIETDKLTPLTPSVSGSSKFRWDAIRWIDEKHILVLNDYKSDFLRLGIINLSEKFVKFNVIGKSLNFDIENVVWNKNTEFCYYMVNYKGYSKLYRAKFLPNGVEDQNEITLPIEGVIAFGDERSFLKGMALSPNGKKLALTLSSPRHPMNVWILVPDKQDAWRATNAGTAGLSKTFIPTKLNHYESFDNLSIPYFKYIPIGISPINGWPAIFIIHGGPEAQTKPVFSPIIQYFLSTGFAVITPNIRGSKGYGRTYLDLDNVEKRLDSIRDIKHLADHIKRTGQGIDSEKLIIFGGSYGGFAVLSAMTEFPNIWRAGVDIFGIADFVTFLKNTAPWRQKLREAEYGSLTENIDTLIRISPIHKVDEIAAPLFIIAGDNDERVPISESIQMYESLKIKGLPVEFLRFPDEGHGITKLSNKIKAYSNIVRWLKEVIKDNK